jgi:hypothetical protein
MNGVRPVFNIFTQDSASPKRGVQTATFVNDSKRLKDGDDGTSRQKGTDGILQRFGILTRENLVEIAVLAERDTSAWNNLESEEDKSQDLEEKGEVERILGKGVEGTDVEENELEKELKEEDEDAEDVAGRGLRQWTFWF